MRSEKVSVSLPPGMLRFIESYRREHHCRSRSQVVEEALRRLRDQELEQGYEAMAADREREREAEDWSEGLISDVGDAPR